MHLPEWRLALRVGLIRQVHLSTNQEHLPLATASDSLLARQAQVFRQ
jgi:hypothetical protein